MNNFHVRSLDPDRRNNIVIMLTPRPRAFRIRVGGVELEGKVQRDFDAVTDFDRLTREIIAGVRTNPPARGAEIEPTLSPIHSTRFSAGGYIVVCSALLIDPLNLGAVEGKQATHAVQVELLRSGCAKPVAYSRLSGQLQQDGRVRNLVLEFHDPENVVCEFGE